VEQLNRLLERDIDGIEKGIAIWWLKLSVSLHWIPVRNPKRFIVCYFPLLSVSVVYSKPLRDKNIALFFYYIFP